MTLESLFTGLFRSSSVVPSRAHDPHVFVWSASVANRAFDDRSGSVGGAGWDLQSARRAAVGEGVERWQTHRLPQDGVRSASYGTWSGSGQAVDPETFVLFHREQYAREGFPFEPLTRVTECEWVAFRDLRDGAERWVPADLAFLDLRPGTRPRFAPVISTGWSAHRDLERAVLRGVQEVIERDALMGAWWGNYTITECEAADVFSALAPWIPARVLRPNLRYRFFGVDSPFSAHVKMVSISGEDDEGDLFSIGSACRENSAMAWEKAILEAVQGRPYVRYLLSSGRTVATPHDFADHALYYTQHSARLGETVLARPPAGPANQTIDEPLPALLARLDRPVLVRNMTPPALASIGSGWAVVRVMAPGLQRMHGDHGFPFLGGSLWADRPLEDWNRIPPHPFA